MDVKTLLASLLIGLACVSKTVSAFDMPVYVSHSGSDDIGRRIVYLLRENIEVSPSLHAAATRRGNGMVVSIISMEVSSDLSAYSVTILSDQEDLPWPYYFNGYLAICGSIRTRECAESITAVIHEEAEKLSRIVSEAIELLMKDAPQNGEKW